MSHEAEPDPAELPYIERQQLADSLLQHLSPGLVGRVPIDVAQDLLKQSMFHEALLRTAGNLSHTAKLLGVSRQAIQQMADRYERKMQPRRRGERRRTLTQSPEKSVGANDGATCP